MILIELTYKVPLEQVDAHLTGHVAFLDRHYAAGNLVFSGRKNPRSGGILLSGLTTIAEAEAMIKEDPFHVHGLADYRLIDFTPSKYQPGFERFLKQPS